MTDTLVLDAFDPQWRSVKSLERNGVRVTVYTKLQYTFSQPEAIMADYERGEVKVGTFHASRPGELPGSTYVIVEKT